MKGALAWIVVGVVAGCSSRSPAPSGGGAAEDARVPDGAPPLASCEPLYEVATYQAAAIGPSYVTLPDPAAPPIAWLGPGERCLALRVEIAQGGAHRYTAFAEEAIGWTATLSIGGTARSFELQPIGGGIVAASLDDPTRASEVEIRASMPSCSTARVLNMLWLDGGDVAVVGYSATDCQGNGGPRSRRAFKADVTYLDDAARAALHDALLGVRPATYRYVEDRPEVRRLGLILDDLSGEQRWVADGDRVDLYAYVTMAVAALQQQQRELDELRTRVEALERTLAAPSSRSRPARPPSRPR